MSGETAPRKTGRGYARNLNACPFQPMIGSFDLHLRAEHKSPKTITIYTDAATWFASASLVPAGLTDWSQVTARHVQEWVSTLLAGYTDQYANNQFRALQQFFKWHATEDPDEPRRNPMANLKPPKIGGKLVPVITDGELSALLAACKGSGFENRRDYAVISLFRDTGARLSELSGLGTEDVSAMTGRQPSPARATSSAPSSTPTTRPAHLTGTCASAPSTRWRDSALWLGVRGGPMTSSGVYQMIERRASQAGIRLHPHMFRHTFSHNWLDKGGAEGDLMELNGWEGPQMLARYGRSARGARARRHYDDVTGA